MTLDKRRAVVRTAEKGSPADRYGVRRGDAVETINGEPLIDEIDYRYLTGSTQIELGLFRDGEKLNLSIRKGEYEPLGIVFEDSLLQMRTCKNRCVFCFIDQMPPKRRESLYVKDDDWRRSLLFGQYVTLTNVDDAEFDRILRRHASPLYVSVHATDPETRVRMMRNPTAARLPERLRKLRDAGMNFHAQLVVCPGYNDGEILSHTIKDLAELYPATLSVALVPVGLTAFRDGLAEIEPFSGESAAKLLDQIKPFQEDFLKRFGTRLVFAADEFYCLSGRELPAFTEYEDFPQIENGVGLLRQFEREYTEAWRDYQDGFVRPKRASYIVACGVSVAPFLRKLLAEIPIDGVGVEVLPIENEFFGKSVTVSGLLTGGDLIRALRGKSADAVLITKSMLREGDNVFLDDHTPQSVSRQIGLPLTPVGADGESFFTALLGGMGENE